MRFGHTGDLGDIIYALPSIKALGGGEIHFYTKVGTREPFTQSRFEAIRALLEYQPYISKVTMWDHTTQLHYDFADFRRTYCFGKSLAKIQSEWVKARPDFKSSWLGVPDLPKLDVVVVNRSFRYRNPTFDWRGLLEKIGDRCVFVGLPAEYEDFTTRCGKIEYCPTDNLFEVAKLISASRGFVGNQSCCNAIAEGLKVYKLLERNPGNCDCLL